jgi:2-polyprenyl-3-methyl-5-hydroxy-6-metoxy-1,4-benzoquinol methylase
MVEWTCPICLYRVYKPALPKNGYVWECCSHCNLRYLWPQPGIGEMKGLYSQEYEPHRYLMMRTARYIGRHLHQRHYNLRVKLANRAAPFGGRLLDAGCGNGSFLQYLSQDPIWCVEGLDLSEEALSIAKQQRVPVYCGRLEEPPFPMASFDVISLWEVLEHLPDPRKALLIINRLLVPGGKLVLSTPNPESWLAKSAGQYWHGWQIPYHLYLFSWENLCRLLAATGFKIDGKRHLPMERYYLKKSIQAWGEKSKLNFVIKPLSSILPLAMWPILRTIDHSPGASAIVLESTAI